MSKANDDMRSEEAKRLATARVFRGFEDAKGAATYFGWNYTTYSQHERGERGIKKAAPKYAKAFRVSLGWLLTGEGAGPSGPSAPLRQGDTALTGIDRTQAPDDIPPQEIEARALAAGADSAFLFLLGRLPTADEKIAVAKNSLEIYEARKVLARHLGPMEAQIRHEDQDRKDDTSIERG